MNSKIVRVVCVAMVLHVAAAAQQLWIHRTPATSPPPRGGHAMAYDSQRKVTVLFGGEGLYVPTSGFLADTWEWDGTAWTQRTPATVPPVRSQHGMTYDSQRGRVVLFGGITNGAHPWSGAVPLGDTWEWDGVDWTQRASANAPSARCAHAMTYLNSSGRVLLFGGNDFGSVTFGDSWEWNGADWQLAQLGGIPPRSSAGIAYDAQSGHAVAFGGSSASTPGSLMGDTWAWTGISWQQALPTVSPGPRTGACVVFDTQRARAVLFGGGDVSGWLTDTWDWDGNSWSFLPTASAPPPMDTRAMVYDAHRGVVVLFGRASGGAIGETWELWPSTTASVQTYGPSCGVPVPTLTPHATTRPLLGQAQINDIANAPFGFAAVAWGITSQSLALDFVGINGCTLLNGAEMEIGSFCQSTSFSSAQHSLAIPYDATLLGVHVYLQAWVLAPGFNPLGIAMSNGLELVIGDV